MLNRQTRMIALASVCLVAFGLDNATCVGTACRAEENRQPAKELTPDKVLAERTPLHRATPDELSQWIEQLGSPEFRVRERAVQELSRCDASAVESLRKAAAESTDLEVRSRCIAIADAIYDLDIGKRTAAFLKDPDPAELHGFDGWPSFSQIAGTSRMSKRLFVELIESHPEHAETSGENADVNFTKVQIEANKTLRKLLSGQSIDLGDSVSLLIQSIRSDGKSPAIVDNTVCELLKRTPFSSEIGRPPFRATLQGLVGRWLKVSKSDASDILLIAINFEISEGIETARRVLRDQNCAPIPFRYATSALMRFGNEADIALLEPWRTEQKANIKSIPVPVVKPMPIPGAEPMENEPRLEFGPRMMMRSPAEVQLYELRYQDLALAAWAHLMKRDDIGVLFPRLQKHPLHVYIPESLAFAPDDNESRQRILDVLSKTQPDR